MPAHHKHAWKGIKYNGDKVFLLLRFSKQWVFCSGEGSQTDSGFPGLPANDMGFRIGLQVLWRDFVSGGKGGAYIGKSLPELSSVSIGDRAKRNALSFAAMSLFLLLLPLFGGHFLLCCGFCLLVLCLL